MGTRIGFVRRAAARWTCAALLAACASPASSQTIAPSWTTDGNDTDSWFARAVAGAGDVNGDGFDDVIVGAGAYPTGGRVFAYYGSAGGLSALPSWSATRPGSGLFGCSVAGCGDINADGYDDVVVGDRGVSNGQTSEGRVAFFLGGPAGLAATPSWEYETNVERAVLGRSVAGAGDLNGDGYDDVVVGADGYLPGGRVWVFFGGATFPLGWVHFPGSENSVSFGAAVGGAGDVNGDGFDDIIVGDYNHTAPSAWPGRAHVFLGNANGVLPVAFWSVDGGQPGVRFGVSVDGAGDVNGDGFDDIIVGADRFSNGQAEEGRAFVFHGGQNGMVPGSVAESDQPFAALGSSVAGAGDVDADGYDDVIVGAQYYSHGQTYEGRGWLFSGTPGGISLLPYWMAESDQEAASFGASVAGAGDVNGDGRPDVIVGASEYNTTQPNVGRVFAYYGGQLLPVGVPPADRLPARLELSPPAPNPVRGDAVFRYRLPAEGRARLSVHDVMGRTVAVLADGSLPAGPHATRWTLTESAGVPAGVYVARLEFAGGVVTRRIAVTR